MLPIIALPYLGAWRGPQAVDPQCNRGFIRTDDGRDGSGDGMPKFFGCRRRGTAIRLQISRLGLSRRAPTAVRLHTISPGETRRAPTSRDHNNSVDMVGHDNECIEIDIREPSRQAQPFLPGYPADRRFTHLPRGDLTEKTGALICAYGNEIGSRRGVIITLQADGAPVVVVGPLRQGDSDFYIGGQRWSVMTRPGSDRKRLKSPTLNG